MNLTKNKWYRVSGMLLLVAGILLVAKAFSVQAHPAGQQLWLKLGPVGLMSVVGGVGFLFLPAKKP